MSERSSNSFEKNLRFSSDKDKIVLILLKSLIDSLREYKSLGECFE